MSSILAWTATSVVGRVTFMLENSSPAVSYLDCINHKLFHDICGKTWNNQLSSVWATTKPVPTCSDCDWYLATIISSSRKRTSNNETSIAKWQVEELHRRSQWNNATDCDTKSSPTVSNHWCGGLRRLETGNQTASTRASSPVRAFLLSTHVIDWPSWTILQPLPEQRTTRSRLLAYKLDKWNEFLWNTIQWGNAKELHDGPSPTYLPNQKRLKSWV